jgi:hypothetical protein
VTDNRDFLKDVIRLVEAPDKVRVDPYTRVLITINRSTGKVEPPVSGWVWNRPSQAHYLVRNSRDPDAFGECWGLNFDAPGKYGDGQLALRVHYVARCQPCQEQMLALKLWPASRPEDALNDFVRGAISDAISTNLNEFIEEYSTVVPRIAQEVHEQATRDLGLDLELEIEPQEHQQMDPLHIPRTSVSATLKDARTPLLIDVEATLGLDAGIGISRFLRRTGYSTLSDRFLERVAAYLSTEVTLIDAYTRGFSSLAPALSAVLLEELRHQGRRLDNVQLHAPAVLDATRAVITVTHVYCVQLLGKADPIEFEAAAELQLDDLAAFLSAHISNLEDAFKSLLLRATQKVLFDLAVNEVLHKLEAVKDIIRVEVIDGLKTTGYSMKSLTLVTDLPEDIVRFPVRVAVDGWFEMANSEVLEGLSVALSARVVEPSRVSEALKTGDVTRTVEERVRQVVAEVLSQTSRDDFFFSFDQPRGSSRWIRRELEMAIKGSLWNDFRLDAGEFVFQRTNSELAELERTLQLRRPKLGLTVTQSLTGEQTAFEVGYRIRSPEDKDWHLFQSLRPKAEDIEHLLLDLLRQRLADEGQIKLVGYSNRELRDLMQKDIAPRVTQEIGVRIEITHWLRKPTEEEIRASGKKRTAQREREDANIAFLTEQWQQLAKKYTQRLLIDAPENELEELRQKIDENRTAFEKAVQALNGSGDVRSRQ